jgi:hypothetical protein
MLKIFGGVAFGRYYETQAFRVFRRIALASWNLHPLFTTSRVPSSSSGKLLYSGAKKFLDLTSLITAEAVSEHKASVLSVSSKAAVLGVLGCPT